VNRGLTVYSTEYDAAKRDTFDGVLEVILQAIKRRIVVL
jgi:hypothetical protein